MSRLFPTRGVFWLVALPVLDLASTLWWHCNGQMIELNPLMRPLLESDPAVFASVKLAGVGAAWLALALYARHNLMFVAQASKIGALGYALLWASWTALGNI